MSRALNWERATARERGRHGEPLHRPNAGREKGITNTQARALAKLQRHAGERYTGSGMTRERANLEIKRLRAAMK